MFTLGINTATVRPVLSDYVTRWIITVVALLFSFAVLKALNVIVNLESAVPSIKLIFLVLLGLYVCIAFGFLLFLISYKVLGQTVPRFTYIIPILFDLTLSVAQCLIIMLVFFPFTYIAAEIGADLPLLDDTLKQLDIALFGFDWHKTIQWIASRPTIDWVFSTVYFSLSQQIIILLTLGSLLRPSDRNSDFIWLIIISLTITAAISVFTPAFGYIDNIGTRYAEIRLRQLDVLQEIRSGVWTVFDYSRAEGIVSFPSFHTTLVVIFLYTALHLHRWALAIFAPLNTIMLISIPPMGGHYIVDVFGGAIVAIISIMIVRIIKQKNTSLRFSLAG